MLGELGSTLSRANKIKRLFFNRPNGPISYTPDEALAFYVDGGFTKASYTLMQSGAKAHRANIYQSHPFVTVAKKKCYPMVVAVFIPHISENSKEVNLIHQMKIFSRFVLFLCSSQKAIIEFGKLRDLRQRFRRSLKIVFKKESQAVTNEEVGKIRGQISSVTPTQVCLENNAINV